jgi:hypothetical protein
MSDDQVTLTMEQALLCRAVLSQDLMKVSGLLGKGTDGNGNPLDDDSLRELLRYSGRLQLRGCLKSLKQGRSGLA